MYIYVYLCKCSPSGQPEKELWLAVKLSWNKANHPTIWVPLLKPAASAGCSSKQLKFTTDMEQMADELMDYYELGL